MKMSPALRISGALTLLTVSLLFTASLLGLNPDRAQQLLESRQRFCEQLAIQVSLGIQGNDFTSMQTLLQTVADRNPEIISLGLRGKDHTYLFETGKHTQNWPIQHDSTSTPTHVQVPIYDHQGRWGSIEIHFQPLRKPGLQGALQNTFLQLVLFMFVTGFIAYYFLIKKVLRHLDPSSVIPGRVKLAMNVIAEGVILIDEKEHIVLANASFAKMLNTTPESLMGKKLSTLSWKNESPAKTSSIYPWHLAIKNKANQTGTPLSILSPTRGIRTMMVNAAPIIDGDGKIKGALATFDDVTHLEEKNSELENMLAALQASQQEINHQNKQLQILATTDPLTQCANRRALFGRFSEAFSQHHGNTTGICCIMCDIDHFKQINDTHGHSVGDSVLSEIASILKNYTRESDTVGRYGGEEFCIVLPGTTLQQALDAAERLRSAIHSEPVAGIRVSASFGVSTTDFGASNPTELIHQADTALYHAKRSGRNCMKLWQSSMDTDTDLN